MFDGWNPWAWVALAWLEVVVAYAGYVIYLRRRERRAREREERT